jgi:hypothetical protein
MIRSQRKAHVRIWTLIAVLLPLGLGLILALAPGPVYERAPVQLDAAPATDGAGG